MESVVSSALARAFSNSVEKPQLPIQSSDLLRYLVVHDDELASGCDGTKLKLTDRQSFEEVIQVLAQSWDEGMISLREASATEPSGSTGEVTITSVTLTDHTKKRKRSEDHSSKGEDGQPVILEFTN
jgi:hypothetical protein